MKLNVLWVLLQVGVCLVSSLCSSAPAVFAQDEVTVAQAQKEARLLKFQIDRLRNLLTILSTNINQINNFAVRIRSILGEVNGAAAAPRVQKRLRFALQHALNAFDTIGCVLPRPDIELECRFKNSEDENVGLLEVVRATMNDLDTGISAKIASLREMIGELKENGLISPASASKINSQLNKIEHDLDPIEETLATIEVILGNDPEEGIQQFLEIIRSDLDQDGEVAWEKIKDARENASRAVGVARDPETKEPTFLRKALIGARGFGALIRKLLSDFTPIPSQLRTTGSIRLSSEMLEVENIFDLSGRSVYQLTPFTKTESLLTNINLIGTGNTATGRAFLALVVVQIKDRSGWFTRQMQKTLLKI